MLPAITYTAAAEVTATNYNGFTSLASVMKLGKTWTISTYASTYEGETRTAMSVTNLSVNGVSEWATLGAMKAALATVGLTVYRYYGSNGKLLGYGLTRTELGHQMVAAADEAAYQAQLAAAIAAVTPAAIECLEEVAAQAFTVITVDEPSTVAGYCAQLAAAGYLWQTNAVGISRTYALSHAGAAHVGRHLTSHGARLIA